MNKKRGHEQVKKPSCCKGCAYWKRMNSHGDGVSACHFLLETGQRRRRDAEGQCLTRLTAHPAAVYPGG